MAHLRVQKRTLEREIQQSRMGAREIKQCVYDAIRDWWPQDSGAAAQDFGHRMRCLQADMIRCHLDGMGDEDWARAQRTLAWLEGQ